ncbi:hypothetical protein [Geoglobus acetivorans]|uniref:Uncharacterized protein n=1 Tax=Geoglobus acetivorans TaxID=565033 RepID=A0ABZ3H622_GEOAI|nr:hypothetical protein [Geoglobus acetivorans]
MVEIKIDGKVIPVNRYVKDVFLKVIAALVSTLKGVPEDWSEIEIKISREDEE